MSWWVTVVKGGWVVVNGSAWGRGSQSGASVVSSGSGSPLLLSELHLGFQLGLSPLLLGSQGCMLGFLVRLVSGNLGLSLKSPCLQFFLILLHFGLTLQSLGLNSSKVLSFRSLLLKAISL